MRATIVRNRHRKPNHLLSRNIWKHEVEVCREKEMPEAEASLWNSIDRSPCKYFLKGTCTKSPCEYWHPPECQFYKTKTGCRFGADCSLPQWKVEEQPNKKLKKYEGKSAVAIVKCVQELSCVSQDTEPPDSTTISRMDKRVMEPIRQVRFTTAALRQANIRERKVRRSGKFKSKFIVSSVPYAVKCEDRSPGETARQERCARGDAWELAREIFKLKKRKTKLQSIHLLRSGFFRPHPQ